MHRPRLLTLVTNWLAIPAPTVPDHPGLLDQAGRAFAGDGGPVAGLTIAARAYARERVAFHAARNLIDDAGALGRETGIVVCGRVEHPLPDALGPADGGVVTWSTRSHAGNGALGWVAVVVQRGSLVWEVTATGADDVALAETALTIASGLARRPVVGNVGEPVLWRALPAAADLPVPMRVEAELAPVAGAFALAA